MHLSRYPLEGIPSEVPVVGFHRTYVGSSPNVDSTDVDRRKHRFRVDGFLIEEDLLDKGEVQLALEAASAIAAGEYRTGNPPQIVSGRPEQGPGLVKIDNAWWADERLTRLATNPAIGQRAADLMDCEEVYLWHDQLLIKPPSAERRDYVGWHQDGNYWSVLAGTEMVTAWVPLADIASDMGPLAYLAGSHHAGIRGDLEGFVAAESEHSVQPTRLMEHKVIIGSGGVSFHSALTMHRSEPNGSSRPRPGIALHLIGGGTRIRRGRLHYAQTLTSADDGEPWRSPRIPRVWPHSAPPADPLGDLESATRECWASGSHVTAGFRDPRELRLTGPLWAWYAGRDDSRPPDEAPDHPLRVLLDAARVRAEEDLGIASALLDVIELLGPDEWQGHRWSAGMIVDVLIESLSRLRPTASGGHLTTLDDLIRRAMALVSPSASLGLRRS